MTKITHDAAVKAVLKARSNVTLRQVSDAFLASLSTNNRTHRAALRSFAVAVHFPAHSYKEVVTECEVCGMRASDEADEEWIWVIEPWMLAHNLEAIADDFPTPTAKDFEIINALFRMIREEQQKATDQKAHRAEIEKGVAALGLPKSNKRDRKELLETLGWCSVLATPDEPGFKDQFIRYDNRGHNIGDWESPFGFWTARDGINTVAQKHFFPQKEVIVVENVKAPPQGKRTSRVAKKIAGVHPVLASAINALPDETFDRPHAGGPPPDLEKKTLAKLAEGWFAYAAQRCPKKARALFERMIKSTAKGDVDSDEYFAAMRDVWKSAEIPIVRAAIALNAVSSRDNPHALLKSAVGSLVKALGKEGGVDFATKLDQDLMRAEVEALLGRALPAEANVVFRDPKQKVFIASLKQRDRQGREKRYLFAGILNGTLTWTEGTRDDIAAMVPDAQFSAAVASLLLDRQNLAVT